MISPSVLNYVRIHNHIRISFSFFLSLAPSLRLSIFQGFHFFFFAEQAVWLLLLLTCTFSTALHFRYMSCLSLSFISLNGSMLPFFAIHKMEIRISVKGNMHATRMMIVKFHCIGAENLFHMFIRIPEKRRKPNPLIIFSSKSAQHRLVIFCVRSMPSASFCFADHHFCAVKQAMKDQQIRQPNRISLYPVRVSAIRYFDTFRFNFCC